MCPLKRKIIYTVVTNNCDLSSTILRTQMLSFMAGVSSNRCRITYPAADKSVIKFMNSKNRNYSSLKREKNW